jgi:hypothetical protein
MPAWKSFENKLFPIMTGNTAQGYNIQYDARMARKTFIQYDAVQEYGGKVFWIDADVVTHTPVPETFLDEMLPDDKFSCYLGRDGWMYTESGFLGFNADHPGCEGFMKFYRDIFLNGYVFLQKAWHDCIAYDWARAVHDPLWFYNLAVGLPHGTMHPFINSPLGRYMDHRKGNRKDGRSTKSDLVITRTEPYWCDA